MLMVEPTEIEAISKFLSNKNKTPYEQSHSILMREIFSGVSNDMNYKCFDGVFIEYIPMGSYTYVYCTYLN